MRLTILMALVAALTLTVPPGAASDDPVHACKPLLMQPEEGIPQACRPNVLGTAWDEALKAYAATEGTLMGAIEALQLAP